MKKILQQPAEQIELNESELEQITGGRRHLPPPPPPKKKHPLPQPQPTLPTQPGVPGAR
jgi:bacteriocin-like protein